MIDQTTLRHITERIIFGSQSNGTATTHSDLDLPVDILVEREGAFYARGALPTMERLILREGVVLYAA